ncbi:MAG: hypothetical protein FWE42_07690 [Defluviitaleaceae bacterium]|nr:hypothetical protein [Defluviitaleaceae bacterium]
MTNVKESNRFMLVLTLWALPASIIAVSITLAIGTSMGVMLLVSQFIIFGIPSIVILSMYSKNIKEILPIKKMGIKNYFMIIAMSLTIQPVLMLLSAILSSFLPNVAAEMIGDMNMESSFFLVLLFIGIVPSVFEELAFRGIRSYVHRVQCRFGSQIYATLRRLFLACLLGKRRKSLLDWRKSVAPTRHCPL